MAEQRHITTRGIILKTFAGGEINRNFIFLSPALGIRTATAFGAAKIKSRFCAVVQPFIEGKFFLYKPPKSDFYKLTDASEVKSNDFIRKDLKFIYLTSFYS